MKSNDVLKILQYSWDPSNYPSKGLKFKKKLFFVLKFKSVWFAASCILRYFALQSTVTVTHFCTVKLKSPYDKSAISVYCKQLSSNSSRMGKNHTGRAEVICLHQCCQPFFLPKKANFGILLKNA
jgi:hypothetical protein